MRRIVILLLCMGSVPTLGQSKKFTSDVDQSLTVSTVAVMPLVDNVGAIYSTPLSEALSQKVEALHRWNVVNVPKEISFTPEDLATTPEAVLSVEHKTAADAVMSGRISKGPHGMTITLSLYSGPEGLPLGTETLQDYSGFEIADLKTQVQLLVDRLVQHVPYRTVVLSRKGTLVTVGIGTNSGVRVGTELTAVQVIKINRHPTFHFIVGTDNLTLGTLKVEKVEDELSFCSIVSERTAGAVTPGTKISWDHFVQYPEIVPGQDGKLIVDPNAKANAQAFGEHPKEWTPTPPPTWGKVGALFGLGESTITNAQTSGAVSGTGTLVPSIHLTGEGWFTPNWFMGARFDTYIYSISNGLSGSSPSTLSVSQNVAQLNAGYNFLLTDDFYGPKFRLTLGYAAASTSITGSTPTAYESNTYGGMNFGGAIEYPLPLENSKYPLMLGGRLNYFFSPSFSETPNTSGASSNSKIASFAGYGAKQISERINIVGEITFDTLNANFSGQGTNSVPSTSSSQTMISINGGIEYMF